MRRSKDGLKEGWGAESGATERRVDKLHDSHMHRSFKTNDYSGRHAVASRFNVRQANSRPSSLPLLASIPLYTT